MIDSTASRPWPAMDVATAWCSLSRGKMREPDRRASAIISSPAMTSGSLLAMATASPRLIAR